MQYKALFIIVAFKSHLSVPYPSVRIGGTKWLSKPVMVAGTKRSGFDSPAAAIITLTKEDDMATRIVGKVEPVKKTWLSKEEAMSYLGCSEGYLDELRNNAQFTFARRKKMIWYELASIEKFFKKHTVIRVNR